MPPVQWEKGLVVAPPRPTRGFAHPTWLGLGELSESDVYLSKIPSSKPWIILRLILDKMSRRVGLLCHVV